MFGIFHSVASLFLNNLSHFETLRFEAANRNRFPKNVNIVVVVV